jgi:hypothetical protein
MTPQLAHRSTSTPRSVERHRVVRWLVLSVLAALLAYFGFRAYLNPELLFHFSNSFYC